MTTREPWRALTYFLCSSIPKGPRNARHCLVKAGQQWGSPVAGVTPQSCSLPTVTFSPCHRRVWCEQSRSQPYQRAVVRGCPKSWAELGYPFFAPWLNAAACSAPSITREPQAPAALPPLWPPNVLWGQALCNATAWRQVKGGPRIYSSGMKLLKATLDLKQIAPPGPKEDTRTGTLVGDLQRSREKRHSMEQYGTGNLEIRQGLFSGKKKGTMKARWNIGLTLKNSGEPVDKEQCCAVSCFVKSREDPRKRWGSRLK